MRRHVHEHLSAEEEERLSDLFNRLDINNDGRIDVKDLSEGLHKLNVPVHSGHVKHIIDKHDTDDDGELDFNDFVKYVLEHEKKLKVSFSSVDHNKDGFIDKEEIMHMFRELGVHISSTEAENLLKKMDKDETLLINWEEWRDHLLFHPYSDLVDIAHFWRHASFMRKLIIDVGDDTVIPDDFTPEEIVSGVFGAIWWRVPAVGHSPVPSQLHSTASRSCSWCTARSIGT